MPAGGLCLCSGWRAWEPTVAWCGPCKSPSCGSVHTWTELFWQLLETHRQTSISVLWTFTTGLGCVLLQPLRSPPPWFLQHNLGWLHWELLPQLCTVDEQALLSFCPHGTKSGPVGTRWPAASAGPSCCCHVVEEGSHPPTCLQTQCCWSSPGHSEPREWISGCTSGFQSSLRGGCVWRAACPGCFTLQQVPCHYHKNPYGLEQTGPWEVFPFNFEKGSDCLIAELQVEPWASRPQGG